MKKKGLTILLVGVLLFFSIAAFAACEKEVPVPDGFSRVTLNYNGADDKPDSTVSVVEKGTEISLPEPTKKGYGFVGWKYDGVTLRSSVVANEERVTLDAVFEKDYSVYSAPTVLFSDDGQAFGYGEGQYKNVNHKVTEIYVSGGYKAIVYSKKDFKGKATTIAYKEKMPERGLYNGKVKSFVVKKVETDVAATYEEEITDELKAHLLTLFAPRFYWTKEEDFFASSVEEAKANMARIKTEKGYYYEVPGLRGADDVNDFLQGDLSKAKTYAFAVEKEYTYLDLTYFVYCPYNYGKKIAGIAFGNHVGDWEHVTVRLYNDKETHTLRPVVMEFSTHSFRSYYPYDEVEKEEGHPVAYIAERSHGFWKSAGEHTYINALVLQLKDKCEKGTKWDSWNDLETYSYDALTFTGKGIGNSEWKTVFDKDYQKENADAVYQWGNKKIKGFLYPRLDDGPTGPQEKPGLCNYYTLNSPEKFEKHF